MPRPSKKRKRSTEREEIDTVEVNKESECDIVIDTDLMLNVVSIPVKKPINTSNKISNIEKVKRNKRQNGHVNVLQQKITNAEPVEEDMKNQGCNRLQDWLVGDVGEQIDHNMRVKDGLKLCFKDMHFKTQVPSYIRNTTNTAKKSYRHLIRGDITVAFKNTNLHEIGGYAVKTKKKTGTDLMLNVVNIPVEKSINTSDQISNMEKVKRTKRKNDHVNGLQERITNAEPVEEDMKKQGCSKLQDLVGDVGKQIDRNMRVKDGSKLCFKDMHFKTQVPSYIRNSTNTAKKSYRHLIRGDITVAFKNTNLHKIRGYAVKTKKKIGFK